MQLDDKDEPIEVRVGQYGPFLRQGENRKSVPSDIYLGDLSIDKALEILNQEINEDKEIGTDPDTSEVVFLKTGPYGPYVQLGDSSKRKAIPKGTEISEVNLLETHTISEFALSS